MDAHADVNDTMFGEKLTHGTPFRRAVEEGLIDPSCVVQIGLRGGGYTVGDYDWPKEQVLVDENVLDLSLSLSLPPSLPLSPPPSFHPSIFPSRASELYLLMTAGANRWNL